MIDVMLLHFMMEDKVRESPATNIAVLKLRFAKGKISKKVYEVLAP